MKLIEYILLIIVISSSIFLGGLFNSTFNNSNNLLESNFKALESNIISYKELQYNNSLSLSKQENRVIEAIIELKSLIRSQEITDADFLLLAGEKFANNHNYTRNGYNCVNYTKDFNLVMNELGYDMFAVRGSTLNKTSAHAWSCASFSSQNGIFTDFREEYPLDRKVLG